MRHLSFLLFTGCLLAVSCGNNTENKKEETAIVEETPQLPPDSKLNQAGTEILIGVVNNYYAVKDALVATNATATDVATQKLLSSTEGLSSLIKIDSGLSGMQPFIDSITTGSNAMLAAEGDDCKEKRVHFETISDAMFGLLQQAELQNVPVYRQYCPMAFEDRGAHWLSNVTDIRNPYWGEKMLDCGEVTDSLK